MIAITGNMSATPVETTPPSRTPMDGVVNGMDYVLSNLVPSTDTVEVPLDVPLGEKVPEIDPDAEDLDEIVELSENEIKRRSERKFYLQTFNSYMLWMKRADRKLYDDIKKTYG